MSMILEVFLAVEVLPTAAEWQEAAFARDVPIEIHQPVQFPEHGGYLPVKLDGVDAGFELYFEVPDNNETLTEKDKVSSKEAVVTFRWGGRLTEAATAFYAAYVLVDGFGGRALDETNGETMDASKLRDAATYFHNQSKQE